MAHVVIRIICLLGLILANLVGASPAPEPEPGIITDILTLVGNLGRASPPKILWTPHPSPECAAINQGELQCCRGSLAGDLPLIVFLAAIYGYKLNPNDINGIICDNLLDQCPGVKLCCQVTALNPLLSLYCQDY